MYHAITHNNTLLIYKLTHNEYFNVDNLARNQYKNKKINKLKIHTITYMISFSF